MIRPTSLNGRVEKLPTWVRNYIDKLERDVSRYENTLATMHGEDGLSSVRFRDMMEFGNLPSDCTVRFGSEKKHGHYIDVRLESETGDNHRDGKVIVRVIGGGRLSIKPGGSNSIVVIASYE